MSPPSLFRNEDALSPDFLPEMLPFREAQIGQIASNIKPASVGMRGQNTFVFGAPGIGKTATVRFVFREMEEEHPNVKTVYINCWDFNTSIAVMSKITNDLGMFVPRRGLGKDEINERFVEAVSKSRKGIVVCLDEVDQLIGKEPGALYSLLRVGQYAGKELTLVLISNDPHAFARLESRVMSSLDAEEIEFKPYRLAEMKGILSERARQAFSSVDSAAIMLAANHAVQRGGDVRAGLQCLQKAGRAAAKSGGSRLEARNVKDAIVGAKDPRSQIVKAKISDNERAIVDIVNRSAPLSFTELYERYEKAVERPVSVRMVQDYVKHLAAAKMIRTSERKVDGKRIIYRQD